MRILVVDDDRAVRESLGRALELEGYEVDLACDGHAACAHLDRETPDAMIVDIGMPGLGGIELCELIRRGSNMPLLVVTADHEPSTRVRAFEAGASTYMTKPFALAELLAQVRQVLRQ